MKMMETSLSRPDFAGASPALVAALTAHGQAHLLEGLDALAEPARTAYVQRLSEIDWAELQRPAAAPTAAEVGASRVLSWAERTARADELSAAGEAAYRSGAVAVLMVAGGQGTRLGSREPKGCFPIGAISRKSLYQIQAEKVLSLSRRLGTAVPLLIMTSPATDAATRAYFAAHRDFGLSAGQVRLFSQGMVPSLDLDGRALLLQPGRLAENPDGHGGCFTALVKSGELSRLEQQGVRYIVYLQVDNLLSPVDDAVLVGLLQAEGADVVTKVLPKVDPDERVGHLVRVGGHDRIVEYTELTPEQVRQVGADGELIYRWGSPAMHCFAVAFLSGLSRAGFTLPLHRSRKPIRAWVGGREQEVPGWKSERFIFDLLPAAPVSLGLEVARDDEFAPVKNAAGVDSPATAVALASGLYGRWLAALGVAVAEGARIEISPLYAATQAQLRARGSGGRTEVQGDLYVE